METPLSPDDKKITYYPNFSAPNEIAAAASWAGFKTCTTASNHTLDQGSAGVKATLDVLDAAHLLHVGTARSATERSWQIYDVRGVRVAHLDYTYGLNGIPVPKDKPWIVNIIDTRKILADAHQARLAGAQFVMVALHWGQEYQAAPTAQQKSLAQALLASPDIDFLYGCHVHVVQPIERIGGKYVVYGVGNLLSKHAPCCDTPQTRDGIIARATVTKVGDRYVVTQITYTPTFVDPQTMTVLPVPEDLKKPGLDPALRQELVDSYQRTVNAVTVAGADQLGIQVDHGD
jgi:poly-gamma-glutamate synthesis protein (capsule biosynthesis protein)